MFVEDSESFSYKHGWQHTIALMRHYNLGILSETSVKADMDYSFLHESKN